MQSQGRDRISTQMQSSEWRNRRKPKKGKCAGTLTVNACRRVILDPEINMLIDAEACAHSHPLCAVRHVIAQPTAAALV